MMAVKAVVNSAAVNSNSATPAHNQISSRPPLVRRHTITSMPLTSACLEKESRSPQINNRASVTTKVTNQSPSRFTDSKNYVGSFNKASLNKINMLEQNSNKPDKMVNSNTENSIANSCGSSHSNIKHNRNNVIRRNASQNAEQAQINCNGVTTPVKSINNNFNTDFYRLCSDTFYNNGSENNLNRSESSASLQNQRHSIEHEHFESLSNQNLAISDNQVFRDTNLASHVNNLFDQWLNNSSSVVAVSKKDY
jgi:hypothetical protein